MQCDPSLSQYDLEESARSKSPDANSVHTLIEILQHTSSDLLGSISQEISKRGIDLYKKTGFQFPQHEKT